MRPDKQAGGGGAKRHKANTPCKSRHSCTHTPEIETRPPAPKYRQIRRGRGEFPESAAVLKGRERERRQNSAGSKWSCLDASYE